MLVITVSSESPQVISHGNVEIVSNISEAISSHMVSVW
jgi:hypothetical protein